MIRISGEDVARTFSIDLAQHRTSGEVFVAKSVAIWDANDACIGSTIAEAAGPLAHDAVEAIRLDPRAWDGDPDVAADLEATTGEFVWTEIEAGHR